MGSSPRVLRAQIAIWMHPSDFECLQSAATLSKMDVDSFCRLAIHRLASEILVAETRRELIPGK